jgi:hypothetical protein
MHSTYAIDIVRQDLELLQARAERNGRHLAAVRAICRRASGLRGLFGGCARV